MTDDKKVIQGVDPTLNTPNAITKAEAAEKEFVTATDVNLLATNIVFWHTHICNQAQHVLNLDLNNPDDPQEIAIRVYDPEHEDAAEDGFRRLSDAELVPFKHGVRYLFDMFEELPFNYTPSDADGNTLPEYATGEADEEEEQKPN